MSARNMLLRGRTIYMGHYKQGNRHCKSVQGVSGSPHTDEVNKTHKVHKKDTWVDQVQSVTRHFKQDHSTCRQAPQSNFCRPLFFGVFWGDCDAPQSCTFFGLRRQVGEIFGLCSVAAHKTSAPASPIKRKRSGFFEK